MQFKDGTGQLSFRLFVDCAGGETVLHWWGPYNNLKRPAYVTTPDISPLVILRWERMCSLRLMTCLSKRKSPPFSEAQQLPSLSREE